MAKPTITILDVADVRLVKFEIPGGVTTPEEFAAAVAEVEGQIPGNRPVLVNGRGPVWGYGMLLHAAHPTPAVATFDPRLGYIVVATHDERFVVGQAIPDPEAQ
jgi:CRISPR-associated protein Csx3